VAYQNDETREERANRILDAADTLIQRFGYKKTTMDDIAKQAGVAKGTLYLHWKTRDDLFLALLVRERTRVNHDIQQQIAADPEGGTLHGMMKHATLMAFNNPVIKALMIQDAEMLGELARTDFAKGDIERRIAINRILLETLRTQGVLRTDIDLDKQLYMLWAISIGFLLVEQFLPEQNKFSAEQVADMTAETIRRTLEVRNATAQEQRTTADTLQSLAEQLRQQSEKEIGL
jgi:AcrR family transcriptional regulator